MKLRNIYEPHRQFKLGIKIWAEMVQEIYDSRELIWRLFHRDFSAKYRQSLLGNIWSVLMPFIAIGTFIYLKKAGIMQIETTEMPYPLYALIGLSFWQIFATGLSAGANSLTSAGDLITKINFPREVLVLASMAQSVFEFVIKFGLIVLAFCVYQWVPSWKMIFLPLLLLPLVLLTIGLSLGLSILNGVMRDIGHVVSLLLMFVMFLTPVLYPISNQELILFQINILSALIDTPRQLVMTGQWINGEWYCLSSMIAGLIFLLSWRVFHLAETKIPERV